MRPSDWPERLAAYVADAQKRPWQWGTHDCCSFARGAVLAVGGPDLGDAWSGSYATEDGARGAIEQYGRDLEAAMDVVCAGAGLVEMPNPCAASRGDLIVLYHRQYTAGRALAAICIGRDAAAATTKGILLLPMRLAVKAWRV